MLNFKRIFIASYFLVFLSFDLYSQDYYDYSVEEIKEDPQKTKLTKEEKSNDTQTITVIIGAGGGYHRFSSTDELRQGGDSRYEKHENVDFAYVTDFFLEYYFFSNLSFGFRYIGLNTRRTSVDAEKDRATDETWLIQNRYLTTSLIIYESDNFNRIGFTAGIGAVDYRYNEHSRDANNPESEYNNQTNKIGFTYLKGIFLHSGGKKFGSRIGVNYIRTQIDKIIIEKEREGRFTPRKLKSVDASGYNFILNACWAF